MPNRQPNVILPHLYRMIGSPLGGDLSDRDLLERFLSRRDPAAFTDLVRRHGPTVLGVCRRVLHNAHDAEDAFQATFLVLARKAGSIARRESLGCWLYGVAYRVALKARAGTLRRRKHERQAAPRAGNQGAATGSWDEVRLILDEEVSRLPDKYRRPVVLCYFEGKTYQEAARLLGCPAGTASVRLARARELLRNSLARRGLGLTSGVLAACMAGERVSASEVCLLAEAAASAAARWLAGPAAAGVSTQVIALTEGVVQDMMVRKWTSLAGVFLVVGLTLGAAGALGRRPAGAPAAAADPPGAAREAGPVPAGGDPLAAAEPPRPPTDGGAGVPAADPLLRARPADPPTALAAPAREGGPPLRSRIGLVNMTRVLKGSKKYQALEADLRARLQQGQQKVEALTKEAQQYQKECDDPTTPAVRREEYGWRAKRLHREIEDEKGRARALMTRTTGEGLTALYREVQDAARRVASARDLELVLFYTDAVAEADLNNPITIQKKMSQPGALMPLVVAPGMDVTATVIEALNRAYEASRVPPP
jgi:RNA polymerase sigma factor (sigma-70 family)